MLAISFCVAVSTPSSPGEEVTSSNKGPDLDRIISTPATLKPNIFAAETASLIHLSVV